MSAEIISKIDENKPSRPGNPGNPCSPLAPGNPGSPFGPLGPGTGGTESPFGPNILAIGFSSYVSMKIKHQDH